MAIPILRTEVYPGALADAQPSNVMGAQPGPIYLPGPGALSDADPATRIRISSAHAADWVVVMNGAALATANQIVVTFDATLIYADPADSQPWADIKIDLHDWDSNVVLTGGYASAYAQAQFRVELGVSRTVTWVIDEAWLNGTHGNDGNVLDFDKGLHWYDTDLEVVDANLAYIPQPHSFAQFRDRLIAAPSSTIGVYLRHQAGGFPYELDITRLVISIPLISGQVGDVRRRFT